MEINLNDLKSGDASQVVEKLKSYDKKLLISYTDAEKQYNPKKHNVFDKTVRPDKIIQQYRGIGKDKKPMYETTTSPVARLAIPYQKLIVERLIGIMLGNKIKLKEEKFFESKDEKPSDLFLRVKKLWKDTKLDFHNRELLRSILSEMESAEIWYITEDDNKEIQIKSKIVSPSRGDELFPYFDSVGNLVAFSRQYIILDENDDEVVMFDTYLKEGILRFNIADDGVKFEKFIENYFDRIPVVYFMQKSPEWHDVQEFCDRQDTLTSNFADTNDYFASPMIKVIGDVKGFAEKGEQGKILTLSNGAEVDYLTWDSGPEAIKTEFDNSEEIIFNSVQIPNFSFSKIKNIGNLQNAILKLFFTDPHMKAETKWEIFGIGIQRRLNILAAACEKRYKTKTKANDIIVEPELKPYVPENVKEVLDALIIATGGEAIMSQQRGVELNPVVDNPSTEMDRLNTESARRQTESFVINGQ